MHSVRFDHDFDLPPARVFAFLGEREHLGLLFGTPVTRVASGDGHRNGVGSRRRIGPPGPLGFEETVVDFVEDELIVYRITKGSPLKDHQGTMRFSPRTGGGTHLDYGIQMGSRVPGAGLLVARMLGRSVPKGLALVDGRA
jgi:uncharacterized protein YndB with AHSA1/START domain